MFISQETGFNPLSIQTDRSDSRGFQVSDQLFDFVLFVHEVSDQSQTLLRVTQRIGGSSLHIIGRRLVSAGQRDSKHDVTDLLSVHR